MPRAAADNTRRGHGCARGSCYVGHKQKVRAKIALPYTCMIRFVRRKSTKPQHVYVHHGQTISLVLATFVANDCNGCRSEGNNSQRTALHISPVARG